MVKGGDGGGGVVDFNGIPVSWILDKLKYVFGINV